MKDAKTDILDSIDQVERNIINAKLECFKLMNTLDFQDLSDLKHDSVLLKEISTRAKDIYDLVTDAYEVYAEIDFQDTKKSAHFDTTLDYMRQSSDTFLALEDLDEEMLDSYDNEFVISFIYNQVEAGFRYLSNAQNFIVVYKNSNYRRK